MSVSHPLKRALLVLSASVLPLLTHCTAQQSYTESGKDYHPAPAVPYEALSLNEVAEWRKELIGMALLVRSEQRWPRYIFGSADPAKGGFDCSGAMHYVLKRLGYSPERTSANQYLWLQEAGTMHDVSVDATTLEHPDFAALTPGDLVFWSGTYRPNDGRTVPVTHVGMYLGDLYGYDRPVMICASKGRSFAGVRRDGYGVYDFKIPSVNSRSKIIGYGVLPPR